MLNDNAKRLLEELERVICLRESMRRFWVRNPHQTTVEEETRMKQLCAINTTIANAKEAIIQDDARLMIVALGQTRGHG